MYWDMGTLVKSKRLLCNKKKSKRLRTCFISCFFFKIKWPVSIFELFQTKEDEHAGVAWWVRHWCKRVGGGDGGWGYGLEREEENQRYDWWVGSHFPENWRQCVLGPSRLGYCPIHRTPALFLLKEATKQLSFWKLWFDFWAFLCWFWPGQTFTLNGFL